MHSYFDLASNQELRVIIPLHASYQGDFYLPAVSVEAMYDHNARANNTGAWVKVVESGSTRYLYLSINAP